MTHLDLFSGIGGFAYAADQVWGDVTHIFCDNEPFAQQVLKKHWPEAYIYDDIRQITSDTIDQGLQRSQQERPRRRGQPCGERRGKEPFLLTGGFPCQPFSTAGFRRGTSDDRYLWPEMLRVIRLTQPHWVVAENVGGLVTWNEGLVLETVCSDMEAAGYEVQPFVIPAVAVNAPHRRDRIWIVGHAGGSEQRGVSGGERPEVSKIRCTGEGTIKNTFSGRVGGRPMGLGESGTGKSETKVQDERPDWNRDWLEVATELCSVDDGLPVELDGFKRTKAQHRAEQIKAYGNAIVPAVAVEIFKAISKY